MACRIRLPPRSTTSPGAAEPIETGTAARRGGTVGSLAGWRQNTEREGRRMPTISEAKILIIATDGFEDSELMDPLNTLKARGAKVTLASLSRDEIEGDKGARIAPDALISEIDPSAFDALLLPGGTKNPDKLRTEERVVAALKTFVQAGKPVAAICHGPWLLAEADVIRGRTVTSWPSIRTDLRNAGANVVDREVVRDGNLVTSRKPEDIPAFTEEFIRLVEAADAPLATA
jgi:protease I